MMYCPICQGRGRNPHGRISDTLACPVPVCDEGVFMGNAQEYRKAHQDVDNISADMKNELVAEFRLGLQKERLNKVDIEELRLIN